MKSPYQTMWLIVAFDLPTDSAAAKRAYVVFRKSLLKWGFQMTQYSVYARYCDSSEKADVYKGRIRDTLPAYGEVRIYSLTDIQYGKTEIFVGKKRKEAEKGPEQLEFF